MFSALTAAVSSAFAARAANRLTALQLASAAVSPHIVCMNRILVEPGECTLEHGGEPDRLVVELGPDDKRTKHVRKVLKAGEGGHVRAGVLDGGSTDTARVQWITQRDSSASLRLGLGPDPSMLRPLEEDKRPRLDLILCMPRPPKFARLLPMISSLGVGTLWVTDAQRVEKGFFASHLLQPDRSADLRAALVEGLEQAGDTAVPRVVVGRNLRGVLEDVTGAKYLHKLVCHPQRKGAAPTARIPDLPAAGGRVLLAIGPERGWAEPEELEIFTRHNFQQVTLGPRTLRSDVAVVSLLSVAHAHFG